MARYGSFNRLTEDMAYFAESPLAKMDRIFSHFESMQIALAVSYDFSQVLRGFHVGCRLEDAR